LFHGKFRQTRAAGGTRSGTLYGLYQLDASDSYQTLILPLNATFLADWNEALAQGEGGIAFGGTILSAPEPSGWMVMILGFGAAGITLRRRGGKAMGAPAPGA